MSETIDWEELGKMLDAINNREVYINEVTMCKDCAYYNIYMCLCNRRNIIINWDAESCSLMVRRTP